jgi:hypothetical protein
VRTHPRPEEDKLSISTDWRDPWPSLQPDWHDPPWLMSGRAVTAWFDAPWELVERAMSPDLLPEKASTVRGRLRFYDLAFEAINPDPARPIAARTGRIREGAVAFAAEAGGSDGEVSLFLWTDSEEYLIWGREAFGWPIRLADFTFSGPLWESAITSGAKGSSRLSDRWGTAALLDVEVGDEVSVGTPSGSWLTPRRVYQWGDISETRELIAVRPVVRGAGSTYTATGHTVFEFTAPHPLHGLGEVEAEIHVADGFELLVGSDTTVIPAPLRAAQRQQ